MHSSRMRTTRLLVVSGGGGRCPGPRGGVGRCSDLVPGGGEGVDVLTWSQGGGGRCSDLVPGGGG